MNRKLAILAPFLFLSTASSYAQSSVTLYGLIDTGITYVNNQGGKNVIKMQSGEFYGSRWGLRGSEDLGGGLKTVFMLENGFDAANGQLNPTGYMFVRSSFVGLSSSDWGALTFGRQYDIEAHFVAPLTAGNIFSGYSGTRAGDLDNLDQTFRVDNTIKYISPSLGGLTLGGVYSPGGVAGNFSTKQAWNVGMTYTRDGWTGAAAYERFNDPAAALLGGTIPTPGSNTFTPPLSNPMYSGYLSAGTLRIITAGIAYRFGNSQIGVVYSDTAYLNVVPTSSTPNTGNFHFATYEINYSIRPIPDLLLGASYAYTHGNEARYGAINTGAHYFLSKRTDVYTLASWQHASGTNSLHQAAVADSAGFSSSSTPNQVVLRVGLMHKF